MKIMAIGGSNSQNSINKALAYFAAQFFEKAIITKFDISSLNIPIYSIDNETILGMPLEVTNFASLIDETDLIILSLAENNGSFNVGLKNLLDWTSRIKERKLFNEKPMILMSTSPGPRGGATVLDSAKNIFPYLGADIRGTFSLPNFYQNFDFNKGITNDELLEELKTVISKIKTSI
ncbi:MAG: NAD(P)H-dependent oxidoreductase [Chitinophagaceae bacterium]|nr:NAD(P)H-dependent oxidoreductase [Chitinophagaceae bacterium]